MGEAHALGRIAGFRMSSGTVSQSAITSNIEILIGARPVRPRPIKASRIAACAVAPVAISTMDRPTREALSGPPVIEASPLSAWIRRS